LIPSPVLWSPLVVGKSHNSGRYFFNNDYIINICELDGNKL
jgi:hypothetical protein